MYYPIGREGGREMEREGAGEREGGRERGREGKGEVQINKHKKKQTEREGGRGEVGVIEHK